VARQKVHFISTIAVQPTLAAVDLASRQPSRCRKADVFIKTIKK